MTNEQLIAIIKAFHDANVNEISLEANSEFGMNLQNTLSMLTTNGSIIYKKDTKYFSGKREKVYTIYGFTFKLITL